MYYTMLYYIILYYTMLYFVLYYYYYISGACVHPAIFWPCGARNKGSAPRNKARNSRATEIGGHLFPTRDYSGEKEMAESFFRGYETALRLHTPEATLASYPGLRGGAGIIYLKN